MAAGLTPIWGIEWDDAIANVGRTNGLHVVTADVCKVDPTDYERPFALHASPPCPNFSNANQGGEESEEDIAIAEAVARFVDVLRPQVFTLENVYKYRKSQSWREIAGTLDRCGYWYDLAHVNAADFSVPQTRKRMIVRAMLGQMVPHLPQPEPWIGWYSAIEDLIPTLPESKFAPWQLERLPELITTTMVTNAGNQPSGHKDRQPVQAGIGEPSPPVTGQFCGRVRAFIASQGISRDQKGGEYPLVTRGNDEPAFTITANHNQLGIRGFLASNAKTEWGDGIRRDDEPSVAVTEQSNGRTRAFLCTGQYAQSNDVAERSVQTRNEDAPSNTVTASNKGDWKAFLVQGGNKWSPVVKQDEPSPTVGNVNRVGNIPRAWLSQGRVVTMTPRALARFQAIPDWYELPESKTLACKIIGNAVPPLLYEKLIRQLITAHSWHY